MTFYNTKRLHGTLNYRTPDLLSTKSPLLNYQHIILQERSIPVRRIFGDLNKKEPSWGFSCTWTHSISKWSSPKQPDEVLSLCRKVEGLKSPQRPKAVRLSEAAANSIGVTEEREMARIEIATLACRYHQLEQDIEWWAISFLTPRQRAKPLIYQHL